MTKDNETYEELRAQVVELEEERARIRKEIGAINERLYAMKAASRAASSTGAQQIAADDLENESAVTG